MESNSRELREKLYESFGIRVHPGTSEEDLTAILNMQEVPFAANPVNVKRETLIAFMKKNRNRLSVWCDGDCMKHPDEMVIDCFNMYVEDNNA